MKEVHEMKNMQEMQEVQEMQELLDLQEMRWVEDASPAIVGLSKVVRSALEFPRNALIPGEKAWCSLMYK